MKIIRKGLELPKKEFYIKHLTIVNSILNITLTSKEIIVLAAFMSADKKLIEEDMFNTTVRKIVMRDLKLSPGGLGNYLNSMIKKGFLTKNEITNKISIIEVLIPEETSQGYQFKIINNGR